MKASELIRQLETICREHATDFEVTVPVLYEVTGFRSAETCTLKRFRVQRHGERLTELKVEIE